MRTRLENVKIRLENVKPRLENMKVKLGTDGLESAKLKNVRSKA